MPSNIFGVPTHPLVVHAVVALVPLAALLGLLVALWPSFRRRFTLPSAGVAVLAVLSIPVATSSGENLQSRLPENPLIERHAQLADGLLPFSLVLAAALVVAVVIDRRSRITAPTAAQPVAVGAGAPVDAPAPASVDGATGAGTGTRLLTVAVSVVLAVAAVGSAVQVARIGHAGAKAAYQGTPAQARPDARHDG